jgi:DNA-binding protein HU-beta
MNKGDLINAVAEAAGITKGQAGDAVNAVFDGIQGTLKKGDKAAFVGFGTFSTSKRAAREGRNPLTGKTIKIAAKTTVKFKAGSSFVELVNSKKK